MAKLLKNERTKLYKKISTWILIGVIVGIILLVLALMKYTNAQTGDYYYGSWVDYQSGLQSAQSELEDDPDNSVAKYNVEKFKYLIDNDIAYSDWRYDAADLLSRFKAAVEEAEKPTQPPADGEAQAQPEFGGAGTVGTSMVGTLTVERMKADIPILQQAIDRNDWRQYIDMRIGQLKAGMDADGAPAAEAVVKQEIYQIYLDYTITPVSEMNDIRYSRPDENAWRANQVKLIRQNKLSLARGEEANSGSLLTNTRRAELERQNDVALERLKTDTPEVSSNSFLGSVDMAVSSISLIAILMMVIAGTIIASEFSTGTVKLLLITPHKRQKIFWAKAILLLEVTLLSAVAVCVCSFLLSGLLYGFTGIGSMHVAYLFGAVRRFPYLLFILMKLCLNLLPVLAYAALAFMLSAVTRKGAVAIAVSLVLVYGSEIIIDILRSLAAMRGPIPGAKFLLFANTNLAAYFPSTSLALNGSNGNRLVDPGMTLGFSVLILLVYTVCFLWIARDSFCRRDIK